MALAKIVKETYDIREPGQALSEGFLGEEICRAISSKGFCTFPSELSSQDLLLARQECKDIQADQRFYRPAPELEFGLLGNEGSAAIAELTAPSSEDNPDGPTLQKIDAKMTELASVAAGCSEDWLDFKVTERTLSWLHRFEETPEEDPATLTEDMASKWINSFARAKIMCLIPLGPRGGSFELTPFDGESDTVEVVVEAGVMLLVREDAMSHNFLGSDGEYVVGCWFLQENLSGARGAYNHGLEKSAGHPAVQSLTEWAWNQINIYKYLQGEGAIDDFEARIPRNWQMAANRKLVRERPKIVVRGMSHSIPNTRSLDAFNASIQSGCDMAIDVPILRWDHTLYYDPTPGCYERERLKTNVKHGGFCDGLDLFDNKFFSISPLEGRVMDPVQRNTLEHNYIALNQAGYTSKGEKDKIKLMQKYIGVYQGSNTGEYQLIPHEQAGGCAGSEGSPAIVANRVSFVLGLMGPSYTVQTDAASALSAVYEGAFDVTPTTFKDKPLPDAAACGGVYLMMTPFWWPLWNAWMDPLGRTCSFDQDSQGHVRADGSGTIVLKRHGEKVDGKFVFDDGVNVFGTLTGWCSTNNGKTAVLHAPHAPSLQVAVADALRMSGISPLDIDAVACNANGLQLHDAVEVSAISKVLRNGKFGNQEVLNLTATIAGVGWSQEANGMSAFFAAIMMTRHGSVYGNIHMKAINPYIDMQDHAVNISQDALAMRTRTSYMGVTAFGFTGLNVHVQISNNVLESVHGSIAYPFDIKKMLCYWPGGGGKADLSETPVKGFTILGSWSSWEELEPMKDEGGGQHSFVVTLGENRFEQFQILLDGDRSRTLHPGEYKAGANSRVVGPDLAGDAEGCSWMIDGSPRWEVTGESIDSEEAEWKEVDSPEKAVPGDMYKVQLKVAGKWKTVVWEKLPPVPGAKVPIGRYFLVGEWNQWTFEEMNPEPAEPGAHSLEICLLRNGGKFQIIRNKDLAQVFHPLVSGDGAGPVEGPSEGADTPDFNLDHRAGDVIRISFKRKFEDGKDIKEISWEKVGCRNPAEESRRQQEALEKRAAQRAALEEAEAAELERLMG